MAVTAVIFPNPVVHSAAYSVFVNGLVAGNGVSVNTYSDGAFADTPVTGTADPNGVFACTITAQAGTGVYLLSVEDTTVSPKQLVLNQQFSVT